MYKGVALSFEEEAYVNNHFFSIGVFINRDFNLFLVVRRYFVLRTEHKEHFWECDILRRVVLCKLDQVLLLIELCSLQL